MKNINWKHEAYRFGYYSTVIPFLWLWFYGYMPSEIMFGIGALWGYGACKLEDKLFEINQKKKNENKTRK